MTGSANCGVPGTTGAYQSPSGEPAYIPEGNLLYYDCPPSTFITKINPTGTALVYSSNLEGSGVADLLDQIGFVGAGDVGTAIAVDPAGNAYITGTTVSVDFPSTATAFQPSWNCLLQAIGFCSNGFVTKLNAAGTALVYSTFLNNGVALDAYYGYQAPTAIAVDATGNAFVAGNTAPKWLPLTEYAEEQQPSASTSTTGFVFKINPTGTALMYGSYFGGNRNDSITSMQVDSSDNVYLAGTTKSTDLPISAGAYQATNNASAGTAFVAKLSLQGAYTSAPLYGTTTTVKSNVTTLTQGSPVTFTATVKTNPGTMVPEGPISFLTDPTFLSTGIAGGTNGGTYELNGSGQASFTNKSFTPGFHTVVATYAGSGYFTSSTSDFMGLIFSSGAGGAYGVTVLPNSPTFSPATGTFTGTQNVTISDASAGVKIQYSTNGGSTWQAYSAPISVSKSTTIQAKAIYTGAYSETFTSSTTSATYSINPPPPAAATPTFTPAPGIYTAAQTVKIADADSTGLAIYYTTNGATPTTSSTKYTSAGISVAATETVKAIAVATGFGPSAVASAVYTIHLPLDTPVLSLKAGTYSSPQTLTITDASPAALLFYTTSGETPNASATRYTGPIAIGKSETLKVIALATGYPSSPVVTAAYTIQ